MKRDALISRGLAVKATDNADGTVTLSGLAVVFDEPGTKNRDLNGEYFTSDTYYGAAAKSGSVVLDVPFHHHIPLGKTAEALELADAIIGEATMTKTEEGWLASVVVEMRTQYEKDIVASAKKGLLGWSTGTAPHVYRATKSGQITRWPLIEVSLTPTPAEPRTSAGVKTLAEIIAGSIKAESLTARLNRVHNAWYQRQGSGYVSEVYDSYVIAESQGTYYQVGYTDDGDGVAFASMNEWQPVTREVTYSPAAKAINDAIKASTSTIEHDGDAEASGALESIFDLLPVPQATDPYATLNQALDSVLYA